jgi:dipeptidyl aminopeptidase/acylaminoacyl peptidase
MTYWAVTHTTRYKAASSGAGATNLISMYGQTDIPHFYTKTYFGKAPWDDFDFYARHSSFFKVHQLVIYPGQAHGITEPRFQKDLLQRNIDWFARWIPLAATIPPTAAW